MYMYMYIISSLPSIFPIKFESLGGWAYYYCQEYRHTCSPMHTSNHVQFLYVYTSCLTALKVHIAPLPTLDSCSSFHHFPTLYTCSRHYNNVANLHLGPRLLAALGEGGGEKLMKRPHAVLEEKLIGVVETDAEGKVRLNYTRLKMDKMSKCTCICEQKLILKYI